MVSRRGCRGTVRRSVPAWLPERSSNHSAIRRQVWYKGGTSATFVAPHGRPRRKCAAWKASVRRELRRAGRADDRSGGFGGGPLHGREPSGAIWSGGECNI